MPYQDIDKAYDDGEQTVVLTKDDLASLPSERSREIEVVEFVPSDQVDLLTLDKAYYLEPDSSSPKAYVLLRKTLEQTDRTAIVRFSLRQKTRLAALRVRGDVLVLQTLLWADEVREAAFPALDESVRISAKELEMSASLVDSFSKDFDPEEFTDEYQAELRTLIDAKLEQATRSTPTPPSARRKKRTAVRSSTSWRRCARASSAAGPPAPIRPRRAEEEGSREEEDVEGVLARRLVSVFEGLRVEREGLGLGGGDGTLALGGGTLAEVVDRDEDRGTGDRGEQDHVDVLGDDVADEGDVADRVAEHRETDAPDDRTMRLYSEYFFHGMWPTPAAIGANVRTTGTKRARITVSPPKRSKNAFVRSTFFLLKMPESLRSKIEGPAL